MVGYRAGGRRDADTCARFPATAALVDRITEATSCALCGCGETLFSTLAPGTRLRPHCGPTNSRLTLHLGIIVPPACGALTAGGEARAWRDGEALVFDDSSRARVENSCCLQVCRDSFRDGAFGTTSAPRGKLEGNASRKESRVAPPPRPRAGYSA